MNTTLPSSNHLDFKILAPVASTLGVVLFLFFIDEGYYSLNWMLDSGNWMVFALYCLLLFPVHFGISEYVFRRVVGFRKLVLMVLVVMPVSILLLLGVFYLIGS